MQAVILAAGESKRFWPLSEDKHKSLVKVCGKYLIEWCIDSLKEAGINEIIIVQSKRKDIENCVGKKENLIFVDQKEAKGMGNALEVCEDYLEDYFLIASPYHIEKEVFEIVLSRFKKSRKQVLVLSKTNNPKEYGIVKFKDGKVFEILEKPNLDEKENFKIVIIYLLSKEFFKFHKDNSHYSFEEALNAMLKEFDFENVILENELLTLKYPWDLFRFSRYIIENKIKRPFISENSKVSEKATIEKSYIGENSEIKENAVIKDSYIGNNCFIGNNSLIRKFSVVENNCVIGFNSEISNTILQENVHFHSGFLGDSIIDKNCRIGANSVTGNRRLDRKEISCEINSKKVSTGLDSLGVIMGEDCKVGISTLFMPGTIIGKNCVIGAGTIVKGTINSNTLIYNEQKLVFKKI